MSLKKSDILKIIVSAACVMCVFTGCGKEKEDIGSEKESEKTVKTTTTATTSATTTKKTETETSVTEKEEVKEVLTPATAEIGENGAKAVCKVTLIPDEEIDISDKVDFEDLYGRHVLHSGVVGLVGAPVEVSFDDNDVRTGKLVFTYDPTKLKGVRPDSLMFMWYDEYNDNYVELESEVDEKNNTVSVDITYDGVYLLVNKYTWYNAWGFELEDDGMDPDYDPMDALSDYSLWANYAYTGDIPELADIDFIKTNLEENSYYSFSVSTPEELASAVYYINVSETDARDIDIIIENNIDLSGIEWAPLGWYGAGIDYQYQGEIIGNGYTISNMTINGYEESGFIGCGFGSSVCDLNFENAKISGGTCGIIIADDNDAYVENCHCTGEVDGTDAGTVLGVSANAVFYNCSVDVIVNGTRETEFMSLSEKEKQEIIDSLETTTTISVDKNYNISRDPGLASEYDNLTWIVTRDGQKVLSRDADNEAVFHFMEYFHSKGHYEVTLQTYIGGYYVPISNTVEFNYKYY